MSEILLPDEQAKELIWNPGQVVPDLWSLDPAERLTLYKAQLRRVVEWLEGVLFDVDPEAHGDLKSDKGLFYFDWQALRQAAGIRS